VQVDHKFAAVGGAITTLVVGGLIWGVGEQERSKTAPSSSSHAQTVTLSQSQLQYIKIAPVELRDFAKYREALGSIDFSEERSVRVFPSHRGKIWNIYATAGDTVTKGMPLFDIDSPDLEQAEFTLISAAGSLKLKTVTLTHARKLFETHGLTRSELDQALSNQRAAEVAYTAALETLYAFGKTQAQLEQIIATRKTDSLLTIVSPVDGEITASIAQPGLLVHPGSSTAPFTVADVSTMQMQAFVPEADVPLCHVDRVVKIHVMAFPGRVFKGRITTVGSAVDTNVLRTLVRLDIDDPGHELRPGMFSSFDLASGTPVRSPALATDSVVREDDGRTTAWITAERTHFARRFIKLGIEQNGFVQVVEGLAPGELAVTEGAQYLSAIAASSPKAPTRREQTTTICPSFPLLPYLQREWPC